MISINEALSIINNNIPKPQQILMPLKQCFNRILAEDLTSPEPLPRYTNSAMDGFAVRWDDVKIVKDDNSVDLKIIGESFAGIPYQGIVNNGETVTVSTGSAIPDGADTVIPIEVVQIKDNIAKILDIKKKGNYVRNQGEEIKTGDIILKEGQELNPAAIGLLASVGIKEIKTFKPPDIAIITTGTELMPLESDLKPWQIRDSNSIMLKSAVEDSNANIIFTAYSKDDINLIKKVISEAEIKSDLILISGGVSVGPHDYVKQAVLELGFKQLFWNVYQKPGKPLFAAIKNNKMLFGLPGNPVSVLNCYAYYVHPVIQKLLGRTFNWKIIEAILSNSVNNKDERPNFQKFIINKNENQTAVAIPIEKQGPQFLTSIANANGFTIIESNISYQKDDIIKINLYPWEK